MARGQVPSPEAFAKNFGAAGVQTFNSPLGSTPRFVRVLFFVFFCDTTKIRLTECLCSWFIREIGVRFEYIKLYLFRKEPFRGEWELFFLFEFRKNDLIQLDWSSLDMVWLVLPRWPKRATTSGGVPLQNATPFSIRWTEIIDYWSSSKCSIQPHSSENEKWNLHWKIKQQDSSNGFNENPT